MNDLKDIPEVPISLPPKRFANPFQGLKGDPTASTVNCILPKEVFVRVKQCRVEGGTIQTTMNHLWIKLVQLLDRKGITGYEYVREFEDAVQRSILVMPEDLTTAGGGGGAESPPAADAEIDQRNDPGRAERLRSSPPSEPQQSDIPSNVSEGSGEGVGRKTRTKRGKSAKKS